MEIHQEHLTFPQMSEAHATWDLVGTLPRSLKLGDLSAHVGGWTVRTARWPQAQTLLPLGTKALFLGGKGRDGETSGDLSDTMSNF